LLLRLQNHMFLVSFLYVQFNVILLFHFEL